MSSSSLISLPEPLRQFFNSFPLYTYSSDDKVNASATPAKPTLWILPPPKNDEPSRLSGDVECLKWQTYISLRGINDFDVRWDISEDAGIDGHLPSLHLPTAQLLSKFKIPAWVDSAQGPLDELEGYRDRPSRDESRAWVTLLEGNVHAAVVSAAPIGVV
ncbi:hypothetical protein FRC02_006601 [Tulasnella sp. 418]|nr:hypothetical protein FRC02_006601 [Tulasnella sp. 418]